MLQIRVNNVLTCTKNGLDLYLQRRKVRYNANLSNYYLLEEKK